MNNTKWIIALVALIALLIAPITWSKIDFGLAADPLSLAERQTARHEALLDDVSRTYGCATVNGITNGRRRC